jgi:hypothetical protein
MALGRSSTAQHSTRARARTPKHGLAPMRAHKRTTSKQTNAETNKQSVGKAWAQVLFWHNVTEMRLRERNVYEAADVVRPLSQAKPSLPAGGGRAASALAVCVPSVCTCVRVCVRACARACLSSSFCVCACALVRRRTREQNSHADPLPGPRRALKVGQQPAGWLSATWERVQ